MTTQNTTSLKKRSHILFFHWRELIITQLFKIFNIFLKKGGEKVKKWIAMAVGLMHINKITNAELAEELNIAPTYLSAILNGKREPKGIEEKIFNAIEKITINKVKNS